MTFVVIFVGLMIERFFDWSHVRVWNWFIDFQRMMIARFQQPSGYVNLAISVVPVLFIVWLINHIFHGWMYGFPSLVFKVFILLYGFGPRNLWADAFASINAMSQAGGAEAQSRLKDAFAVSNAKSPQALHRNFLSELFISANHRIFSVVFWFILAGPVGVVLYRLVALSAANLSQPAQTVTSVLDWAPTRIITVFFALGGQFMQVLNVWRKKAGLGLFSSDEMIAECGLAAVGVDDETDFSDNCKIERSAVSLIDRSLVIVLVVLALIVLV